MQSSLGPEHTWNDTVFLKTIKNLSESGDIEQITVNCGFSPVFKKRRTSTMTAMLERQKKLHPLGPSLTYPYFQEHHSFEDKPIPCRKTEHPKNKIVPKKLYDLQHVPIKNPMDTH